MTMWKLATQVSLLALGTVLVAGVAPSYAGTFSGTYGFDNASLAATEGGVALPTPGGALSFGNFGSNNVSGIASNPTNTVNDFYRGQGFGANFNANNYFSFSDAPTTSNKIVDITNFGFKSVRASDTAPTTWRLDARLGNSGGFTNIFTSAVGALSGVATSAGLTNLTSGTATLASLNQQTISQSINNALLKNVTGEIQFRLYGYGGSNGGGNTTRWYVDDVALNGDAIPTPAAIPAMIAFGAGLWRKRKQEGAAAA